MRPPLRPPLSAALPVPKRLHRQSSEIAELRDCGFILHGPRAIYQAHRRGAARRSGLLLCSFVFGLSAADRSAACGDLPCFLRCFFAGRRNFGAASTGKCVFISDSSRVFVWIRVCLLSVLFAPVRRWTEPEKEERWDRAIRNKHMRRLILATGINRVLLCMESSARWDSSADGVCVCFCPDSQRLRFTSYLFIGNLCWQLILLDLMRKSTHLPSEYVSREYLGNLVNKNANDS